MRNALVALFGAALFAFAANDASAGFVVYCPNPPGRNIPAPPGDGKCKTDTPTATQSTGGTTPIAHEGPKDFNTLFGINFQGPLAFNDAGQATDQPTGDVAFGAPVLMHFSGS